MKTYISRLIVFIPFLIAVNTVSSQNKTFGTAMIKNFKAEDYKASPEVFSIVQNRQGIIYFAGVGNVLEFDGTNWRKIVVKPGEPILSLAIDSLGYIYCSAGTEFGVIAPDTSGNMQYRSLSKYIKDLDVDVPNIGKVHVNKNGIYFQTYHFLYHYPQLITRSLVQKGIEKIKAHVIEAENAFSNSYNANNHIFVLDSKKGLMYVKNNSLQAFKYSRFIQRTTVEILPYDDEKVVVCTDKGMYLYKLGSGFYRFDAETDAYLNEISLLSAANLNDAYALATINRGTIVLSKEKIGKKRRIIERFDKSAGLPTEQIVAIYNNPLFDENLLWLSSNYGISLTRINSPLRKMFEAEQVNDIIQDMVWNSNIFYVRTIGSIYYLKDTLDEHRFFKISDITENNDWTVFPLQVDVSKNKKQKNKWFKKKQKTNYKIYDHLLVTSSDGLYALYNKSANEIEITKSVSKWKNKKGKEFYTLQNAYNKQKNLKNLSTIYRSVKNPNRIFVASGKDVLILSYQHGEWIHEGIIENLEGEISKIEEDDFNNLWFVKAGKGVYRLELPDKPVIKKIRDAQSRNWRDSVSYELFPLTYKIQFLSDSAGLTQILENGVFRIHKTMVFATKVGLFTYDYGKNLFVPYQGFGTDLASGVLQLMDLSIDKQNNCWLSCRSDYFNGLEFFKIDSTGKYTHIENALAGLPQMTIQKIYHDDNNLAWISGTSGLFVYNSQAVNLSKSKKPTFIRKIKIGLDSVLFAGNSYVFDKQIMEYRIDNVFYSSKKVRLHYDHNNISFEFAAPLFENHESVVFSYQLSGFDEQWSQWTSLSEKEYLNLPSGKFIFRVKAKDENQVETEITEFKFEIAPPWYKTWWAYSLYILIFGFLVYLFIKFYTRRLVREKEHLENLVAERTKEIRLQKEEIEHQNEQIKASITYASRIQEAMLPKLSEIKQLLPQTFILFKPKEIVSGDFYWFAEKNGIVHFTAADSTGHGVPGAFMSMIGDSLLNQIVNDRGIDKPDKILEFLHRGIRLTLKQHETENRDGMDIAFCSYNPMSKQIEFAGAKNPIIYVQKGEINQIRGDRVAIGGLQKESYRLFTNHIIDVSVPTMIYLFSDGFQDQFGGDIGDKYMSGNFKKLLLEIHHLPVEKQKEKLEETFENWRGSKYEQVDDVLIIGVKIS